MPAKYTGSLVDYVGIPPNALERQNISGTEHIQSTLPSKIEAPLQRQCNGVYLPASNTLELEVLRCVCAYACMRLRGCVCGHVPVCKRVRMRARVRVHAHVRMRMPLEDGGQTQQSRNSPCGNGFATIAFR